MKHIVLASTVALFSAGTAFADTPTSASISKRGIAVKLDSGKTCKAKLPGYTPVTLKKWSGKFKNCDGTHITDVTKKATDVESLLLFPFKAPPHGVVIVEMDGKQHTLKF